MKTSYLSRLMLLSFSFTTLLFLAVTAFGASNIYQYQEQKGKKITPFTWKIESTGTEVRISVFKKEKSYTSTCNKNGETREWQLDNGSRGTFEAIKNGNLLNVTGKRGKDKEPYENAVGLNDQPWFQPLYYSLGRFLKSSYRDISFWTIQEGEIEPVVLSARKRGMETVTVNGERIEAQKIEVHSDDFFSKLWRGFYWFRKSDNRLVMYRSTPGVPGVNETVVTLISGPLK